MKTITFANKSYLNENASVPAENKVRDIDMNEIKEVVNDNTQEYRNTMGVSSNTWSSSGTYTTGSIVIYNNVFYENITGTNTNTNPESDTTNWQKTSFIQNSQNNSQSNAYSCDFLNNNFFKKSIVLWENASPGEMNANTNITLSSSNYDAIIWIYALNINYPTIVSSQMCLKGTDVRLFAVISNATDNTATRDLVYDSATSYIAGDGYLKVETQARRCVPLKAIGIIFN